MRQNWVAALFGLSLFFLVIAVFYSFINIIPTETPDYLQIFIPFIVLSGFFIFQIGAMLVALSIFKWLNKDKKQ